MVYKCAAINCRSGYDGESKDPNVTFHAFPLHDQQVLQAWHKRLARNHFTPTKYLKLYSIHFIPEDFVSESNDQSNRRKGKRKSTKFIGRRSKSDAYPTIFTNLPSYFSYESELRRSGLSSSTSRHENEAARLEDCCESFLNADKLESFNNLMARIAEELPHQKYLLQQTNSGAYLCGLFLSGNFWKVTLSCEPSLW